LLTIEKNSQRTPADTNQELQAVLQSHQTRIRVVGCGGGGNNTITRLLEIGVNGVETLAINTDAQDLLATNADEKILIGKNITKGLGAGSIPQIGEDSARENQQEIEAALQNTDMVFVTCGLGGGTGTGSAPVVAEVSKKLGALTIAVVTVPFTEEGVMRWDNAWLGLEKLRQNSDTVIVIQNDRLLEVVPDMPLGAAFKVADEILVNAVKGITELIMEKGLVNLDFADVRAIMQNGGTAMIGLGESEGVDGAKAAVEMAMQNRLLDVNIMGAKSALINITGGAHMPLKDAKMVMKIIAEKLDASAKLIWGARIDQKLDKSVRVMLIVTGLQEKKRATSRSEPKPHPNGQMPTLLQPEERLPAEAMQQNLDADGQTAKLPQQETQASEIVTDNGVILQVSLAPQTETSQVTEKTVVANSNVSEVATPRRKRRAASAKPRKRTKSAEAENQIPAAIQTQEMSEAALVQAKTPEPIARIDEVSRQTGEIKPQAPARVHSEFTREVIRSHETSPFGREEMARSRHISSNSPSPAKPKEALPNRLGTYRAVNPNAGSPLPGKPKAAMPNHEPVRRVAKTEFPPLAKPRVNQPTPSRQGGVRQSQVNSQTFQRPRAPASSGPGAPAMANADNMPKTTVQQNVPPATVPIAPNKIFEEKSRPYMQTIRESIGHLFVNPTQQGTLRCLKNATQAINNAAQRSAFRDIADYAATVEEICVRVLDGEISLSKRLLNAFTEIPGIFEGMIRRDADAIAEAKRHQDRLQRLADSYPDSEIVQAETNGGTAPPNTHANSSAAPTPNPVPASPQSSASPQQRPNPAAEVMEYLDDLFTDGKAPTGR
jgi:cell division protein FtsZ